METLTSVVMGGLAGVMTGLLGIGLLSAFFKYW